MNDDMNSDNMHDKIDYARTVLEHNFQLINFAGTKASRNKWGNLGIIIRDR